MKLFKENFILFLCISIFLNLVMLTTIFADEPASVFFYNPDANIQNLELLIKSFTDYFKPSLADFKIQPFINIETLVNITLSKKPGFIIIPYWNFILLQKDKAINPMGLEGTLTPMVGSNVYYKKIIVSKTNSGINDLNGVEGKVASTSLGLQSVDFLNEFLFQDKIDFKKINFIWTNKDVDSLLALKFNQVKVAIVSDKTYNETKKTQPQMIADIKIIKESKDIPEVVLVTLKNNVNDKIMNDIKKLFLDMHSKDTGKKILNLLGYEKWVEFKK